MTKSTKKFLMIVLMVILICAGFIGSVGLLQVYAEGQSDEPNKKVYSAYTNTDRHVSPYSGNSVELMEYELYYASGITLYDVSRIMHADISHDNEITLFVPKELFKTEGVKTYVGKEYGFIVDTFSVSRSDPLHSIVLLFDIEISDNMLETYDHLLLNVSPVFQGEFAYVTEETESFRAVKNNPYLEYSSVHTGWINVEADGEYVIPVPTSMYGGTQYASDFEFREVPKYYLKDFKSVLSLYNENHLNAGDDGYSVLQDYGAYFTQMDFSYTGHQYSKGAIAAKEREFAVSLGVAAGDFLGKNPIIGAVLDVASYVSDAVGVLSAAQRLVTLDTAEKHATYQPDYTIREQQIEHKGYLTKTAAVEVKPVDGEALALGTGDWVEMDYQISSGNWQWKTRYAAAISLNAVCVEEGGKETTIALASAEIREGRLQLGAQPELQELQQAAHSSADIYLLPNGQQVFLFTPLVQGSYALTATGGDCAVNVYETYNFTTMTGDNAVVGSPFSLKADTAYYIEVKNTGGGILRGTLSYDLVAEQLILGDSVLSGDYGIFSLAGGDDSYYDLYCATDEALIRVYNEQMTVVAEGYNSVTVEKMAGERLFVTVTAEEGGFPTDAVLQMTSRREIMFVSEGETIGTMTVTNGAYTALPQPDARIGYAFAGWRLYADFSGQAVTDETVSQADGAAFTLYAKWEVIEYTIVYEENGGNVLADGSYTVEDGYDLPQDIIRQGYIFLGWYDNTAFSGNAVTHIPLGSTGNKTFYAYWAKEISTLSEFIINANDIDGQTVTYPSGSTSIDVQYGQGFVLPVPVSEGFTFEGWYYGNERITDGEGNSLLPYAYPQEIPLTAKWSRKTITFKLVDEDGASVWVFGGGLSDTAKGIEYYAQLSPNDLVEQLLISTDEAVRQQVFVYLYRDGYIYDHLTFDEAGTQIAGGQVMVHVDENNEVLLYPQYTEEQYTVFFECFGKNSSQVVGYGDAIVFPSYDSTGYIVDGWYDLITEKKFSAVTMYDLTEGTEGNGAISLELRYQTVLYTITYVIPTHTSGTEQERVYNHLVTLINKTDTYTVEDSVALPSVSSVAYVPTGWYEDINLTKPTSGIVEGTTGNKYFYLTLDMKEYTVTFNSNGGSACDTVQVKYGHEFKLPKSTRNGYMGTWDIWTFDAAGQPVGNFGEEYTVTSNVSFTALWKKVYKINYEYTTFNSEYGLISAVIRGAYQYVEGYDLDISQYTAAFTYSAAIGQKPFEFIGWCSDAKLTKRILKIPSTQRGDISLYARWSRVTPVSGRFGKYTINDSGRFNQKYDTVWIENDDCGALLNMGFQYLVLHIQMDVSNKWQGYRYVFPYDGTGEGANQLCSSYQFTDKTTGTINFTFVIDLNKVKDVKEICIRYGASGNFEDDWYNDNFKIARQYVGSKEDIKTMQNGQLI